MTISKAGMYAHRGTDKGYKGTRQNSTYAIQATICSNRAPLVQVPALGDQRSNTTSAQPRCPAPDQFRQRSKQPILSISECWVRPPVNLPEKLPLSERRLDPIKVSEYPNNCQQLVGRVRFHEGQKRSIK